ncbi:MAG: M23 family metallopeptidase [Prochloraceae cyanobacterium]
MRLKRLLLVVLFMASFYFTQILPIIGNTNNIPIATQPIGNHQVIVPDWSQVTWSSLPPIQSSGEIIFPQELVEQLGYDPSRSWQVGESADRILKLGDIAQTGAEKFTLQQLYNLTGIDLRGLTLEDFKTMNWQTIDSIVTAIPGLEDVPVREIKFFYDFISTIGNSNLLEFGNITISEVLNIAPDLGDITFGSLGDAFKLSNYDLLGSIPGLIFSPIDTLKDWGNTFISQVPGLNLVPFNLFPIGFGLGANQVAIADIVWSKSEHGDPRTNDNYFVSGKIQKSRTIPVRCPSEKPCAYVELTDLLGSDGPFYGKRWASGETQQVNGGEKFLKIFNGGKEPTGKLVYGDLFKVAVISTDESSATAQTGLYFRVCVKNLFTDLGCTPYAIGPVPWIPIQEGQLVVMGGTAPAINIPDRFASEINEIIAKYEPRPPQAEDFCAAGACVAGDGITTGNKQHPIAAGTQISSGFGWRSRPAPAGSKSGGKAQFHAGVDFAAPIGTPVRAIDGGVVVKIGGGNSCPDFGSSSSKLGCGGQLGNWIDIRHSDGTVSRYGHLQQGSIVVRKGMAVSSGQAIGAVGNSGYSTGPHLDFRVHNGKGGFIDPGQVIPY